MNIERQLCAGPVCMAVARRTIMGSRYCLGCAQAVEQAAYIGTLPPDRAERVAYRRAMVAEPPPGVTLPEPLAAPPRSGWRSRK